MDTLILKLHGDPMQDLQKVWDNPKKNARPGTHTIYLKGVQELNEVLSPQRLKLTMSLMEESSDISSTAKKLKRKQEAISRDATILEAAGIIEKIKKGRKVILKPKIKKIEIEFC